MTRVELPSWSWCWLLVGAACAAASDGESSDGGAGSGGAFTSGAAGAAGAGGANEVALPGPCRESVPPHLCAVAPSGFEAEMAPFDANLYRTTQRVVGEVVALGGGFTPSEAGPAACLPAFGVEEGMARSGTHADWIELALGGGTFLISFSAPQEPMAFGLGQILEVDYTVLDDLLLDFGPKTRSLTVRDVNGDLLLWLAASSSVDDLNDVAPPEVGLSSGAEQCRVALGCGTRVQQVLEVLLDGLTLHVTQGDIALTPGYRVLAGQSEAQVDSSSCKLEGFPQNASIGVWRIY